jgi:hypothetical protein
LVVLHPPDRKKTIEAGQLERTHRRLRPNEDEQLASLGMLVPARSKEQCERGRVDEGDRAEVDGKAANLLARNLRAIAGAPVECGFALVAARQGSNCPRQSVLDFRGAVEVELPTEYKNGCSSPVPLEGKREVVDLPGGGPGLRPRGFPSPR